MKYLYRGVITFDKSVDGVIPRDRSYFIVAEDMHMAFTMLMNRSEVTAQDPYKVTDRVTLTRIDPHDVKGLNP